MGIALDDNKLAIALKDEILVTSNAPGLAKNYPDNPNVYDNLFVPRISYYTGEIDVHDLSYTNSKLIAVNTSFSCLMEVNEEFSFKPVWKPKFISALMPEDRCHLNGMAIVNNKPKYVTALGTGDSAISWKENMLTGGVMIDIDSDEIILENLPVPHSPRMYSDGLYMLLSATGELTRVDVNSGRYEVITKLNGFLRGMDRIGDYMFIAMSKLRPTSSLFKNAPIAEESVYCGISIVYIPSGKQIGYIIYNTSVEELYEVKILKNMLRPNIMNIDKGLHKDSVVLPERVFWKQKETHKL
jgi:uncharacterized protein (TIGR03032 family)